MLSGMTQIRQRRKPGSDELDVLVRCDVHEGEGIRRNEQFMHIVKPRGDWEELKY